MPVSLRLPVFVMESQSGLVSACLLEAGHPWSVAGTAAAALSELKEYVLWRERHGSSPGRNELADAQVRDIQIRVRPEYRRGRDQILPCPETLRLTIPCVHGRQEDGLFMGLIPTLDIRFLFHEMDILHSLAVQYAQDGLAGRTPLELMRHCRPKWRGIEHLVVVPRASSGPPRRPGWHEDEALENLAGVAEPLQARGRRIKYARACRRERDVADLAERIKTGRTCVLLVGEPGVGKSTILADAARLLERREREERDGEGHARPRLWVTNALRLIAGMAYLGQWQERCEEVIRELSNTDGVLCVENLLELVRTGGSGPLDGVASFLMPYLRRGELLMVAESTPAELEACRRLLPGLTELFQILTIPEFSGQEARAVMSEMAQTLSRSLRVTMEDGLSDMAHRLFARFMPYSAFPGQAVAFLVAAFEQAREQGDAELTRMAVLEGFIRQTGLPELFVRDEVTMDRAEALDFFRAGIIGQDRACETAADLAVRFKAGMNDPLRPIGVLIFCGPTGVGKTALAKRLGEYFFGHGQESGRLIRLDMSEYGGPDGGLRLVTGPDGGASDLIKRMRKQPFSLVLLDEVEKAHPRVFDVLMNVFDEGRLADPFGRVTSFRSSIIVMTSNLGGSSQGSLGFGERSADYEEAVRRFFRPEFFNRMDTLVTFAPLQPETVLAIAAKELAEIPEREGLKARGIRLEWSQRVLEHVARAGFDPCYGARPLQRAIETAAVTPLARFLAAEPGLRDVRLFLEMGEDGKVRVESGPTV
jgi:ATP-dependent Clp protease ATP-binding subunit ClpC